MLSGWNILCRLRQGCPDPDKIYMNDLYKANCSSSYSVSPFSLFSLFLPMFYGSHIVVSITTKFVFSLAIKEIDLTTAFRLYLQ